MEKVTVTVSDTEARPDDRGESSGVVGNVYLQRVQDRGIIAQLNSETDPKVRQAAKVLNWRLSKLAGQYNDNPSYAGHIPRETPMVLDVKRLNSSLRVEQWLTGVDSGNIKIPERDSTPNPLDKCGLSSGDDSPEAKLLRTQSASDVPSSKTEEYRVVDISENTYNSLNREIHDCIWCPCLLYTMFLCCIPAFLFMHNSDKLFQRNQYQKAKVAARISTCLYGIGLLLFVCFFAGVGWLAYSMST